MISGDLGVGLSVGAAVIVVTGVVEVWARRRFDKDRLGLLLTRAVVWGTLATVTVLIFAWVASGTPLVDEGKLLGSEPSRLLLSILAPAAAIVALLVKHSQERSRDRELTRQQAEFAELAAKNLSERYAGLAEKTVDSRHALATWHAIGALARDDEVRGNAAQVAHARVAEYLFDRCAEKDCPDARGDYLTDPVPSSSSSRSASKAGTPATQRDAHLHPYQESFLECPWEFLVGNGEVDWKLLRGTLVRNCLLTIRTPPDRSFVSALGPANDVDHVELADIGVPEGTELSVHVHSTRSCEISLPRVFSGTVTIVLAGNGDVAIRRKDVHIGGTGRLSVRVEPRSALQRLEIDIRELGDHCLVELGEKKVELKVDVGSLNGSIALHGGKIRGDSHIFYERVELAGVGDSERLGAAVDLQEVTVETNSSFEVGFKNSAGPGQREVKVDFFGLTLEDASHAIIEGAFARLTNLALSGSAVLQLKSTVGDQVEMKSCSFIGDRRIATVSVETLSILEPLTWTLRNCNLEGVTLRLPGSEYATISIHDPNEVVNDLPGSRAITSLNRVDVELGYSSREGVGDEQGDLEIRGPESQVRVRIPEEGIRWRVTGAETINLDAGESQLMIGASHI